MRGTIWLRGGILKVRTGPASRPTDRRTDRELKKWKLAARQAGLFSLSVRVGTFRPNCRLHAAAPVDLVQRVRAMCRHHW
ncbi:Hypothetical predicted protein [Cloeon dipterum]|nr:Hypothetical predicted protein [Cloeon dipterum]